MVQTRLQSGAQLAGRKRKSNEEDDKYASSGTSIKLVKSHGDGSKSDAKKVKLDSKPLDKKASKSKSSKSKSVPKQTDLKTGGDHGEKSNDDKKHDDSYKNNANGSDGSGKITINRAPVLHLWSACVAHSLHPKLSWSTCLSVGAAISTLCAISKGRAVVAIEPKDKHDHNEDKKKKKNKKKDDEAAGDEIEVMNFHLRINGKGQVMVGDKAQAPGEDSLRRKFASAAGQERAYERVKAVFEEALETWTSGDSDEENNDEQMEHLSSRAFKMYEEFRPNVSKGQKGWGRKGELDLEAARSIVGKS